MTAALRRVEALVYRYPIAIPVRTSFGAMHDRPAVFVRVTDGDGAVGWGEVWCNFPTVGAEHRARLVAEVLAPLIVGRSFATPAEAFREMTARTAVLALQSGEGGPLAQSIAGVDIALTDLAARRAGEPLWRWLGGRSPDIRVYASGINPTEPERLVAAKLGEGHRAFKLKIGFGQDVDLQNLAAIRAVIGDGHLAADANQAWSLDEAKHAAPELDRFGLAWLEEPLRADRSWAEWRELASVTRMPLAAGENIAAEAGFATAIEESVLGVVQPDLAKWGGFSGCLPVARGIVSSGAVFCPHYLGAGIGLVASAHLLAAAGGDGLLEMDVNENPLRDDLAGSLQVKDGAVRLSEAAGLGLEPDLGAIANYRVACAAS